MIFAAEELAVHSRRLVVRLREQLLCYAREHPGFLEALAPVGAECGCPDLVKMMCEAGHAAGVGPMAAVAGAVAECVGTDLEKLSSEVIVENGGDIYIIGSKPRRMAVFAGESPLSMKVNLLIPAAPEGIGVCTSSGTVGHSLSLGRADAAVVISPSAALADAAATAVGNMVQSEADIEAALTRGMKIPGAKGILIISGDKMGAIGAIELAYNL